MFYQLCNRIAFKSISCCKSNYNFPSNYYRNLNIRRVPETKPTNNKNRKHQQQRCTTCHKRSWCNFSNRHSENREIINDTYITSNWYNLGQFIYSKSRCITSVSKPFSFYSIPVSPSLSIYPPHRHFPHFIFLLLIFRFLSYLFKSFRTESGIAIAYRAVWI